MSASPLRHADLWHTGVVVDDLAAAMVALGDELGVTWHEGGAEVQLITDDSVRTVTTAYALSKEGPHHVELGQSIEGTLWTVTAPGHAHHLGYWVDDVVAASAALVDQGSRRIATIAITDEAPPMCAYHRTPNGLVVEVVSRGLRRVLLPEERA
jgi:Glyoxalase/Bleomycin resistance protein/Dioxygenase superfamily